MKRECPECKTLNSEAKRYCDGCGARLKPDEPEAKRQSPRLPAWELEQPERFTPKELSPARRGDPVTLAVVALLAIGVAAHIAYRRWQSGSPSTRARLAAQQYLQDLKGGDFKGAYALLSSKAKEHCLYEEFALIRSTVDWDFSNLRPVLVEPDAVLLAYTLTTADSPPREDFLIFSREGERWVRPFQWNLLNKIERAFDENDAGLALALARDAVAIDPRDPMARAYLCEAAYYRGRARESESECRNAIQLHEHYPSKLNAESLYHLHAILGDTYKNSLKKYKEAAEEYTILLAFPDLSPQDNCDLRLARADCRLALGQRAWALEDAQKARPVCESREDSAYIDKLLASIGQKS